METLTGVDTKLGSLGTRVLIPAFSLSDGKPYEFRNYGKKAALETTLVDVALATSAAPTYFPIHNIGGRYFVDGGLHANTPDILAISEALSVGGTPLSSIEMVSIGTTYSHKPVASLKKLNFGQLGWLRKLEIVERLLEAQNQGSIFLSDRFLSSRYIRLNKFLETQMADRLHLARADKLASTLLIEAAASTWRLFIANEPKLARLDHILR